VEAECPTSVIPAEAGIQLRLTCATLVGLATQARGER
jgi:hypothetical protein